MRDIRFRAWHKQRKEMFEVGAIQFREPRFVVTLNSIETWTFDEVEIIQFTGLLDKNGTEIYAGHIVKFVNHLNGQELLRQCKWDTKYPSFVFCGVDQHSNEDAGGWKFLHYLEETNGTMEIIGTVWENPELLTA